MFRKIKNTSKRSQFTRMCIGEAIVSLIQTKEYEKITVSDIAKKAGVSRMTYYHYYDSKDRSSAGLSAGDYFSVSDRKQEIL